jgi:hypothetical protein
MRHALLALAALTLTACAETHELIIDAPNEWSATVGSVQYDPFYKMDMTLGDVFADTRTGRHVIRLPNDGLTCWLVSATKGDILRVTHRVRRGILGTDTKSDATLDTNRHRYVTIGGCTDIYSPTQSREVRTP